MLVVAYLLLFLAISAALTYWRVASYRTLYRGVRVPVPGRDRRGN